MNIMAQLIRDEGLRTKPYRDLVGKLTIGVGHNLDDKPISRRAALVILEDDINDAKADLKRHLPWTDHLDEPRYSALINMTFNLGIYGLLGFKKTLDAIKQGNWQEAHDEILDSAYALQTGDRAKRVAKQILTGTWV